MENALWRKSKSPIVSEYLQAAKQAEDIAAQQGILYRPGYLGDINTRLETVLKYKLSDLNYQIVKEAIERELAQTGHDYDIAVQDALISWELEKVQELTALEQEFADNKMVRELTKQELDRWQTEVNLRQLVIIAAKAQYEEDMEDLKREIFDIEITTFPYETALLDAKLLTAQKKLEVIPYIEAVLEKQQAIIDAETNNADLKTALITEKEKVDEKKRELITAREAIADAIVTLIAAKESLVDKKGDLLTARELISDVELENVAYLKQYIQSLTGLDDMREDLIEARTALIPKLNEKSLALIAYAAEIDAWVIVKRLIAGVKESQADEAEIRADRKELVMDAKIDLNVLELALKEARLNLQTAQMLGHKNLLSAKIVNAAKLLSAQKTDLNSKVKRENSLLDKQLDHDIYVQEVVLETLKNVEKIQREAAITELEEITDLEVTEMEEVADAEFDSIDRIANAAIEQDKEIARLTSETEVTSKLVHLLT